MQRPNMLTVICLISTLLLISTNAIGANNDEGRGWGIGLKFGASNMKAPTGEDSETKFKFDFEVSSPRFLNNYFDCYGEFGFSHLKSEGEIDVAYKYNYLNDYVPGSEARFELNLYEFRLGVRLYPYDMSFKNDTWRIVPFLGGGAGYFISRSTERSMGDKIGSGLMGDSIVNYYELKEDHETWANGFFPFIVGGINIHFKKHFYIGCELKYDFSKKEDKYNYTGLTYTGVLGFRW